MRYQRITNRGEPIILGYRGENNATQVSYDIPNDWTQGEVQLRVVRHGETDAYVPTEGFEIVDGVAYWLVSSTDTAITGEGVAQYCCMDNGKIIKSATFTTIVKPSADNNETPVEPPEKGLIEAALEQASKAASTAAQAVTGANTAAQQALQAQQAAEVAAQVAQGAIYDWFTLQVDESTGRLLVTENERGV